MSENIPPSTSAPNHPAAGTGTSTNPNAANRGLPYYEKLRRELRDTLQKKRLMDKSMAQLEDQIYRFEQSYLEETTAGNIIKGFDNYIKGSSAGISAFGGGTGTGTASAGGGSMSSITGAASVVGGGGAGTRRRAQVLDSDRVFSRSSASFMRDSPNPSSTPSHAPTPLSTYNGPTNTASTTRDGMKNAPSSKNNKKKSSRAGVDDDGDDGDRPPVKRLKITYGRD